MRFLVDLLKIKNLSAFDVSYILSLDNLNDEKIAKTPATLKENEKKLADFDAARKKPGNLFALGELKVKHIRHILTKEPLPSHFPKIKASTEDK